jgi:xanthine/CO dehydrogenase XdhC/CoxF family maturation factor
VHALIEVIPRRISLVIFGADQDAVPVARFASELGWRVAVVDSRVGLATAARVPTAESVIVCPAERAADSVRLDDQSAAVIMMHQYVWDMELLRRVLASPIRYVGILGPRERTEGLLHHLGSTAASQARGRLYAPIGLDIGAETSEEIAFAIVAEIQAVLAGRAGGSLRDRPGPIHERLTESDRQDATTPPTG